ncbi:TPA: hypothetical protein ACH3X1_002579 [Trebouxia sp. C0004]
MSQPKRSAARPSTCAFSPIGQPVSSQKISRMAQLRKRTLIPALVSRTTRSDFGKDSITALDGQRTALNGCKLPSIFDEISAVRSKNFEGLEDVHSGRAYLEHNQGSSGIRLINKEPWIEVTGLEMGPGSLPDHQQQGRLSALLETRGKAKKQRCSLNSSAGGGVGLTPLGGLFGTLFPAFASIPDIHCVSWPLSFMLSQLVHQERLEPAVLMHIFCMAW